MAAERLGRLRPTVTIPYPENENKKNIDLGFIYKKGEM